MSRGQSRSTALCGSGEGRGARSARLTAQPEKGQVNRSVWAREATPGHCSKLGGRSGLRTRDINKATREKASGHPHPATPPPPQQTGSRPGRTSLLGPPPDAVPNPGLQPPRDPARSSPRPAYWPGQLGSLQRPRPCPPPARPLHCAASRRRRLRAHLAGLPSLSGTLRSRTRPRPQPGPDSPAREGSAPSRSQPVRPRASQLDAGTHPRPRARTARAPPAPAAR